MGTTLTITVIESNGVINEEATLDAVRNELAELRADRSTSTLRIAAAVDAVYDRLPISSRRPLFPHLVSMTIGELNVDPTKYSKWVTRVEDYLRANSQGKKVNGSWERPNSIFVIGKGSREGGVARRADLDAANGQSAKSDSAPEASSLAAALDAAAE